MSEESRETLSALMDGELPQARASRSIDVVTRDPELKRHWERYHLVRDALRNNLHGPVTAGLRDRVRSAVDSEPIAISRHRRWRPSRPRGLAVTAVACSAVVAAIGTTMWLGGNVAQSPSSAPEIATADSPPTSRPIAVANVERPKVSIAAAPKRQFRWNDLAPAVETRLNGYLVNHTEHARGGMRGMLPYARIVAYERGVE